MLQTGDIQVTLRWHADGDVDLEVTDPFGDTVAYYNPAVASGGFLDVDSNVSVCGLNAPPAVENIVWSEGDAVDGTYTVRVREYDLCTPGVSPTWQLVSKVGGVVVLDQTGAGYFQTSFVYPHPPP